MDRKLTFDFLRARAPCDPIKGAPVPHALARSLAGTHTYTQRNVNLIIWWLPLSAAVRTRGAKKNARVVILAEEVFWSERSVAAAFLELSLSLSLTLGCY